MLTLSQIDALAELERKATQGKWERDVYSMSSAVPVQGTDAVSYSTVLGDTDADFRDLDLIAAARNALPDLIRLARIGMDQPRTLEVLDTIQRDCADIMRDTRLASSLHGAVLGIQTVAENHARALRIAAQERGA